jgi:pSer/pThr/pTyr-binding forkhead associated (FHA) protein
MTAENVVSGYVTPPLTVRAQGSAKTLRAGPAYWVGRDPAADIVIDEPLVSWRHAVVKVEDGRWLLADTGSTNGTFAAGQRVQRVEITDSCQVRLGHPEAGPVLACAITDVAAPESSATAVWSAQRTLLADRAPSAIMPLPAKATSIGRAQDNDIVVADLGVSRRHAELRRSPGGGYEIADLGSHNGTFLNGQRVSTAVVTEADVIGVGLATFRLVGDELQEFVDAGDISLDARGLTVTLPNGKVLLDDVSFPLSERCLLGVIGPSGAGKSTLLGALTGVRPATAGSVLYDGRDLYADYAELRHRIGLVPQENILHTQLSAHWGTRPSSGSPATPARPNGPGGSTR